MKIKSKFIIISFIFILASTTITSSEALIKANKNLSLNKITPSISNDSNTIESTKVSEKSSDSSKLCKFPQKGIPMLMYHSISLKPKNSLCVSIKQFNDEMAWLHSHNYHTLSIDEFYQALISNASIPDKSILITFDDGYADNYKNAWPILKQYGFKATFFIVSDWIGNYYMNWDQLKELVKNANSIGSHTAHHHDLTILTYNQQKRELGNSKKVLEDHLGLCVKAFCYPAGHYNKTTLKLLPELGYSLGFTTKSGIVHLGDNQFRLKRIRVWGGMSLSGFKKQVS